VLTTLDKLDACHEIAAFKHRYVRAVEERNWDVWADCFTEDVTAQFMPAPGATEGEVHRTRAELREWLPGALEGIHAVIRVSMPDIEILGSDRARADWALVERLAMTEGPLREVTYYGYYHETYEKGADGRWRIASLRMTRFRNDVVDRAGRSEVHVDLADRLARAKP